MRYIALSEISYQASEEVDLLWLADDCQELLEVVELVSPPDQPANAATTRAAIARLRKLRLLFFINYFFLS